MGVIKGCNIFWGKKLTNTCSFVGGCIIMQKKKILTAEHSWTNPMNVLQQTIHCCFIKFCIYCFFLWYEFSVRCALRIKKIIKTVLMRDLWNFNFFSRGDVSRTVRTLSLCFGVTGKTPGLISQKKKFLFKKYMSASAIAIMSWQIVTRSSLCSGVKECGTKRSHNFLFPKSSFRI